MRVAGADLKTGCDEDLRVADGDGDQRRTDDGAQQQRGECTSAGSTSAGSGREVDEAESQARRAEVRVGVVGRQRDAANQRRVEPRQR